MLRRVIAVAVCALCVAAVASTLRAEQQARSGEVSGLTIALFVGTWISILVGATGLWLTLRRDRATTEDRVARQTATIARNTLRDEIDLRQPATDERTRWVTRDVLARELGFHELRASVATLHARVEELNIRLDALPTSSDVHRAVSEGVTAGVAEAARRLASDRVHEMIVGVGKGK